MLQENNNWMKAKTQWHKKRKHNGINRENTVHSVRVLYAGHLIVSFLVNILIDFFMKFMVKLILKRSQKSSGHFIRDCVPL